MKLSIITTLYNSAPYLEEFHRRIKQAAEKITNNYEVIFQQFGIDDPVIINTISKNLSALAQEGVLRFPMNELIISNPTVQLFYNFLKKLMTPEDEKIRRRFKRIIPPERIIRLADMVYSLTSVSQFNNSKSLF